MVTTSPERRQVAEELARQAFASFEKLAEVGAEAVAISTPTATHVTLAEQALRLGLAVACRAWDGLWLTRNERPAAGLLARACIRSRARSVRKASGDDSIALDEGAAGN